MSSPLDPALANLFMGHYENKWLESREAKDVLFYKRYVDDIFCIFDSEEMAESFLSFLNSRHPSLSFTIEKETSKQLPFLDILLSNKEQLITSVYKKKTNTGLMTNFFSFTPFKYKVGLLNTLVDRAFKINSTWQGFHKDVENIKHTLLKNEFPLSLINSKIKTYVSKVQSPPGLETEKKKGT